MSVIDFQVVSSNPTEKKDGFITKIQNKSEISVDILGTTKTQTKQLTYYIKTDGQAELGKSYELNPESFKIVERPFTPTEGENAGEIMMLKWLHL